MQKTRIVIASILKPVTDTRACFRFGFSLRETNKYEINIIGFSGKKENPIDGIDFHPIFSKKRNHPSRLLAPWKFLWKIRQIKPQLLIVSTYELLPFSVLGKWIWGYKLVYDVQENYLLNIGQNRTLEGIKKRLAAWGIKLFESGSKPWIDHFILAESCYRKELPGFKPATVLENKFYGPVQKNASCIIGPNQAIRFLISGTVTEVYGVLEGIRWFVEFQKNHGKAHLHVLGHCPMDAFAKRILPEVRPQIMTVDLSPIPIGYGKILDAYANANVVLLPYWQIPSIRDKMPSKLYEAIGMGKIVLHSPNPKWENFASKYQAGMAVDFRNTSAIPTIIKQLNSQTFFAQGPDDSLGWQSEQGTFLKLVSSLTLPN